MSNVAEITSDLALSQILVLEKNVTHKGGKLSFIHKFMFVIKKDDEHSYVKMNLYDKEYYLFSKKHPTQIFSTFDELVLWVENNIL
ncbi:hypothetical protein IMZ31_23135 (plasmid) [Pontibacillus sp. ALD_SL1]|uniref:hypothetical protein n=1 Tax=Pontibacillus sp. ALD_SL1 TaxID=2777185 RepID=UPI001A9690AD|nr:hypothetical protein [Pontibacillus sp. ALD_SL1]QST02348.1 hypothetical protein IMZ31_23135 [Pontibacillus sp. ALD_SL1]